ncbi:MAG: hypothetical protein NTZ12_03755, partial [Candidatus Aminicenantes bacterium]|nr:hypothetical protein [Candidatus Aminicenantes bacterium]
MDLVTIFNCIKEKPSLFISLLSLFLAFLAYRLSKKIKKSRVNCLLRETAFIDNSNQFLIEITNLGPGTVSSIKVFSLHLKAASVGKLFKKYVVYQFKGPIDIKPDSKSSFALSTHEMSDEGFYYIEWDDLLFKKNRKIIKQAKPNYMEMMEIKGYRKMILNVFRIAKMKFEFRKQ